MVNLAQRLNYSETDALTFPRRYGPPTRSCDLTKLLLDAVKPAHSLFGSLKDLKLTADGGSKWVISDPSTEVLKLPILQHLNAIHRLLWDNQCVSLTGGTGTGKSTALSLALMLAGYRVVVNEPRILATEYLARRCSSLLSQQLGEDVGCRTSRFASFSDLTRLTFCTDGLQVIRELLGHHGKRDILIIDEFHERNLNQDVLYGWIKLLREENPDLKVIIMSATIDSDRISKDLGAARYSIGDGSIYPIEHRKRGLCIEEDVEQLVLEGRNVLVFAPGKHEIHTLVDGISRLCPEAVVLPLHSDLNADQQRACFDTYTVPKVIVATNIAESSITIPDVTAVVDTGMRRQIVNRNGIQALITLPVSQSESIQRAGRGARVAPGVYIDHNPIPWKDRAKFPEPEILRCEIANVVLRVRALGDVDIRQIPLLDKPSAKSINLAEKKLRALQFFDSANMPTQEAYAIATLPLSVSLSRMIIEARRRGVLSDVLKIASLIESEPVIDTSSRDWKRVVDSEIDSDLIAHLRVFELGMTLERIGKDSELINLGFELDKLKETRIVHADLVERIQSMGWTVDLQSDACRRKEQAIIEAYLKGFPECVFLNQKGDGAFRRTASELVRHIPGNSVCPKTSRYVVGIPLDINTQDQDPRKARRLIQWATPLPTGLAPKYIKELERTIKEHRKDRVTVRMRPRGGYRR